MERPLRILQLNSMLLGGGTDDQVEKLSRGLVELGQDVRIFGPAGREYSRIIQDSKIPFVPAPASKPRFIISAAKLIKRCKIEIVHGHHGRDLWPAILAGKLSGTRPKIVLTRHMAKSPSSFFSRRYLLNNCDSMIAVSHFVKKVLTEGVYEPEAVEEERRKRDPILGEHNKITVIYGGIDTNRFKPLNAEEQRQKWRLEPQHYAFGIVGGYNAPGGKGQWQFLEAAAQVHQEYPHARFLIIGRGNMESELNRKIRDLNLSSKAWLTGYCDNMPLGMNALDCLVHPATGTEALGLVIVEAMACGKPVIASNLDGIPEAFEVGGKGVLIGPRSVRDLASAMRGIVQQGKPAMLEKEKLHGRVAARFSYQTMAANTIELYDKVLSAKKTA